MIEKKFKGFLILDYKHGTMKVSKRKPTSLNPYHIFINVEINVKVPEKVEHNFKGEIEISETKFGEIVLESLEPTYKEEV